MIVGPPARSGKDHGMRRLVLLVEDCFDLLDLAGPLQVAATVNQFQNTYETVTVSLTGGPIMAAAGLQVSTGSLRSIDAGGIDTILVIGGAHGDEEQRRAVA